MNPALSTPKLPKGESWLAPCQHSQKSSDETPEMVEDEARLGLVGPAGGSC